MIQDIFIDNARDKGISIGEKSSLIGQSIEIKNSNIGLACKDLSKSKLTEVNISHSTVGIACYQKKPEFGPARIEVDNSKLTNLVHPFYLDDESKIIYNSESINIIDVTKIQKFFK